MMFIYMESVGYEYHGRAAVGCLQVYPIGERYRLAGQHVAPASLRERRWQHDVGVVPACTGR
ncbi:hypothetical protein ACI01F_004120 [Cronobacter sakazakii]